MDLKLLIPSAGDLALSWLIAQDLMSSGSGVSPLNIRPSFCATLNCSFIKIIQNKLQ
jgi:hypothetical protein